MTASRIASNFQDFLLLPSQMAKLNTPKRHKRLHFPARWGFDIFDEVGFEEVKKKTEEVGHEGDRLNVNLSILRITLKLSMAIIFMDKANQSPAGHKHALHAKGRKEVTMHNWRVDSATCARQPGRIYYILSFLRCRLCWLLFKAVGRICLSHCQKHRSFSSPAIVILGSSTAWRSRNYRQGCLRLLCHKLKYQHQFKSSSRPWGWVKEGRMDHPLQWVDWPSEGFEALAKLKEMMFGGSTYLNALGDRLVEHEVNLVSHYSTWIASIECLMG